MAKQQTTQGTRPEQIHCKRCGEDYSSTYRRCPFCDDRKGRHIDDHRSPLYTAVLIISLILIFAAAFIVFSKVAPLLTSRDPAPTPDDKPGVEDPFTPTPSLPGTSEQPGTSTPTDPVTPVNPNAVPARAVALSREDFTLVPGETFTLTASVSPADTTDTLVWSCDRPDVLTVNQDGSVINNNTTGSKVTVIVTATAGGVKATCIVRCNSSMNVTPSTPTPAPDPSGGNTPAGSGSGNTGSSGVTVTGKINAKVVGASSGLNVRSGPGSNYEKIASIQNGNSVVILENTGTGWYKIDYGGGKTGYASVDYIQPK